MAAMRRGVAVASLLSALLSVLVPILTLTHGSTMVGVTMVILADRNSGAYCCLLVLQVLILMVGERAGAPLRAAAAAAAAVNGTGEHAFTLSELLPLLEQTAGTPGRVARTITLTLTLTLALTTDPGPDHWP